MEEITHHGPVVWFVRHAQSVWNEAGIVQGQALAPGLTEAGKVKAELVAQQLMGCGAGVVLTSDLLRARQTASPIAHRLSVPLVVDPTLRERNLGTAEGRPSSFLLTSTSGHNGEVVVDPDARPAGGESLRQLHARLRATGGASFATSGASHDCRDPRWVLADCSSLAQRNAGRFDELVRGAECRDMAGRSGRSAT